MSDLLQGCGYAGGQCSLWMSGYERATLYRLAAETGLRALEIRSLMVSNIDLEDKTVTVATATRRIDGRLCFP